MDFVQIGCIAYDDLESPEQRDWLDRLGDEHNRSFVEVAEGDASKVYAFAPRIYTFDELMNSDYCKACYVAVDEHLTDEYEISKLDAVRERSYSCWSGELCFRPVED